MGRGAAGCQSIRDMSVWISKPKRERQDVGSIDGTKEPLYSNGLLDIVWRGNIMFVISLLPSKPGPRT